MKKFLKVVAVFFLTWFFLLWIIGLWSSVIEEPEPELDEEFSFTETECAEFYQDHQMQDGDNARTIQRAWFAYDSDDPYCARYAMYERDQRSAERHRNGLRIDWDGDYIKFWNTLYGSLARHDEPSLSFLRDSLQRIATEQQLSPTEFANMVVSFVQDIPYEFILPEGCKGNERKPCNGNVGYGIYAPAEFAYTLKGDCDTRTVLLYSILEGLGIDAVILNSYEYAHSMIGVNLPFSGDYLRYRGKRYYFWETTNVGWLPGQIPPDWSNKDYWTVVLD